MEYSKTIIILALYNVYALYAHNIHQRTTCVNILDNILVARIYHAYTFNPLRGNADLYFRCTGTPVKNGFQTMEYCSYRVAKIAASAIYNNIITYIDLCSQKRYLILLSYVCNIIILYILIKPII